MKLTHYIAVLCLAMVSLVSCKSTEPETRTASSRVMFSSVVVSGVAEGQTKSYRGILASKDTHSGEWKTDPDSEFCTEWECAFGGANGVFATTRNRMYYPEGTFKFYALGYDGREQFRTENGVLAVEGGENAGDYILATTEVSLDGVNNAENVALNFSHLFAQVRFELILRSVEVDGVLDGIELVDVSALGYRLNGEIDLGADDVKIAPTTDETVLENVVFGKKYMVIPHDGDTYTAPTETTIRVRFDGKEWEVALDGEDNMTLTAGKCRVIRITYNGVSFTTVGIPQWSIGEDIVVGDGGSIKVPQWK